MNPVERFLYRHQILTLTERKLERWNKNESIDELIFAANNGIYNIRLRCIEFLSGRTSEPKIKSLLISMISDDVEIVSKAAIEVLEDSATPELMEVIKQTRKTWRDKKKRKKRISPHLSNIQFGETSKGRPSERLMDRLREQQRSNEPPYGI